MEKLTFEAEVWEANGKASWSFVTLPADTAEDIRFFSGPRRGWGSVTVTVQLGASRWKTSVFPESRSKSFVLPLKAAIRKAEGVRTGDRVRIELELVDV